MAKERQETDAPAERRRPPWADLHLWQMQPVRDVLLGLGVFGLLILGQRLSLVTVPLLLALMLAYLFEPLIKRMQRVVSRRLATSGLLALTGLLVVLPLLIGTGFAVLQAVDFAAGIAERTSAVRASINAPDDEALRERVGDGAWGTVRDTFVELNEEAQRLEKEKAADPPEVGTAPEDGSALEESSPTENFLGINRKQQMRAALLGLRWVEENAKEVATNALDKTTGALTVAFSTVVSVGYFGFGLFLTAFFFFFIASGWPQVVEFLHEFVPSEKRGKFRGIVDKMDRAIHGFIRGRLTIAFFLGIFYTIGFWVMGVPAPLFLGPAVAVITLIPYAAMLAIPVVIVLMWLEGATGFRGTTWWILGAPIVYYNLGQALDDYVLTPLIQGKETDLETPTILFASIAGGVLFGFYGLLLAIPIAACVKILLREIFWPRFKAWSDGRAADFLPLDREG